MVENLECYLAHGRANAMLRNQIEQLAAKVLREGFENIFFAGSGGTYCMLYPFVQILKKLSTIPSYVEESGSLAVQQYKQLNRKSLVVIASKTGETEEAIKLLERCTREEISTVAFVGNTTSQVYQKAKYKIGFEETITSLDFLPVYYFVFSMLHLRGEFPHYEKFCQSLEALAGAVYESVKQFVSTADDFSKKYMDEPFQLYIGSGFGFGEVNRFAACIVEEVLHIQAQAIDSAEFFHGCFEIVNPDTCVTLLVGEDESREVDLRVKHFLETYGGKVTVIDMAEYPLTGISKEFRAYVMPVIANALLGGCLRSHMEQITGRNVGTRKYYRIVDY